MTKMFRLDDQVVIVTGGAGLYGKPISTALAEAGAQVIIASRNENECKSTASALIEDKLKADGMSFDLGKEDSIRQFVSRVKQKYGRIDVLVNNAVSREGYKDLGEIGKADWEKSQAVNSTGMVLLTQEVLQVMLEKQSGNIINIGSIQGAVGPNFPVYGSTGMTSPLNYTYDKWAMIGFTKWIANRYGKNNIRCNCISPGGYGPGISQSFGENEFTENYKRLTPLGRFAEDNDIKGPVVFLASTASSYITGHNLLVDGGWTSW
ncbi:MAG: SDR family oxidoreductase [Sphingobacteriales bacterium]|nr:SDR family oxidoreductase [Sphingobacteriales bacterium]